MKRFVTVAALALALLATAGCQPARRARAAEEARRKADFERAAYLWRSLARRGDAEAQYQLGLMYRLGQGVDRSQEDALVWLRRSAEQGHTGARDQMVHIFLSDPESAEGAPDVERWMRETAEAGSPDTRYKLAVRYLLGELVEENPQEAIYWLNRSQEAWLHSRKTIGDRLAADNLLHRVAELGFAPAQYRLGRMYTLGEGLPQSRAEGVKWYYLGANQGDVRAEIALARVYANGIGVAKDQAESARWYRKAAEQGDAEAQFQLGQVYREGKGVVQSNILAHVWFNLAAAQGHAEARELRSATAREMSREQILEAEALAVEFTAEEGS